MIQHIEFRIPVSLSDEQSAAISFSNKGDVTLELLPKNSKKGLQFVKVAVDVPAFLCCGDYEENTVIHDIPLFIEKIHDHIAYLGLPTDQLHSSCEYIVDKLAVGFNVFIGNRDFYREEVPPTECIRYSTSSKWVYHIGPKVDFLTAFRGQGKKLMLADSDSVNYDYLKHISIHEGIFSYRFDLTSDQMDQISRKRRLDELLDASQLYKVLQMWSSKLYPLPIFDSLEQLMNCIDETNASIQMKQRLKRFLLIFLNCGYNNCKKYYSRASFIRHYSDVKKLLEVPAILLREFNDKEELFLQSYEEWLELSRQGRGGAELVPALTSGL